MAVKKKGLGAKGLGLNALINTEMEEIKASKNEKKKNDEAVLELDLDMIEPNRKQPRKYFDETALEELAASLKAYGMIQPIVVKKNGEYYEIIAGERRWRAAKIAGLTKVPVVIKKWEEGEAFDECAKRELREETGIISSDLQEIRRIVHGGRRSLYVEFLCITDWDKNAITLQNGETVDYQWVEKSIILEMKADELASSRSLSIIQETDL